MKIGIIGTRGIPNAYGGFEQFASFLAPALVARGHEVWVYNSHLHPFSGNEWKGVHIIHCRDWEHRIGTAGQFLYDLNCFRDARSRNFDVLLQLGYTSSSVWHALWPDTIHIINMDGLEWKRAKYSRPVQAFLRWAEKLAVRHGDILVADSRGIQDYLQHTYQRPSFYIPYGADIPEAFHPSALEGLFLSAGNYFLVIARMEPENHIETIIKGFLQSGSALPLVLVGSTENKYGRQLKNKYQDQRLLFTGSVYEEEKLNALRHYSKIYFHGHSVGGTNPSLLEAMAAGCTIAAHHNPFNRSVLGASAFYFMTEQDVSTIINSNDDPAKRERWKVENEKKIREAYNWQRIVGEYEELFSSSLLKKL